ncbi:MAG: hypothetical protein KF718_20685 [Polyangiaceae bacterium]|nr:hypothetical protein [Polyangiaceae bacterium]
MTESVWGPVFHGLVSVASLAFALSCSSGGSSGGGGGDCARACAHAAAVCPDQFSNRDKCESGCSQLSPGQVACLGVDTTCALLESCVGDGPFVDQAGGATTAQCQQACSHAAARCPEQFSDQTKCQSGCAQISPGQAACLSVESSCALLTRCVDE